MENEYVKVGKARSMFIRNLRSPPSFYSKWQESLSRAQALDGPGVVSCSECPSKSQGAHEWRQQMRCVGGPD